jgi:GSH-dependent disulfide-bond oxidoreductase
MIELYYWPTPNGHKITLFLEEAGVPYEIKPINIGAGEQFGADFLKIAPNNRMPAIIDTAPRTGTTPISVFESGAILLYLAHKEGQFGGDSPREHFEVLQWLMWQMGGLGPMAGQNGHFTIYAPEKVPYAINRYVAETNRLYGVLDRRLTDRAFVAGDNYTVADMAIYPWIVPHEAHGQTLSDFPNLQNWFEAIAARPATIRAYAKGEGLRRDPSQMSEEEREKQRQVLFGQTAKTGS